MGIYIPSVFDPEADQKPNTAITTPVTIRTFCRIGSIPKKGIKMTQRPKIPVTQFCHIDKNLLYFSSTVRHNLGHTGRLYSRIIISIRPLSIRF